MNDTGFLTVTLTINRNACLPVGRGFVTVTQMPGILSGFEILFDKLL